MRGRLPLLALLGSALAFLASLYLPWEILSATPPAGIFDPFSVDRFDGWVPGFGQAAGVLALALAVAAGASLFRPRVASRTPLAACAVAILFLALMNAAQLRAGALFEDASLNGAGRHLGSGAYLGVCSALVALAAAAVIRRHELTPRPSATGVAGLALSAGLLAAFFLPLARIHAPHPPQRGAFFTFEGVPTIFAAAFVCFGFAFWTRPTATRIRLATAGGAAVLTGAYLSSLGQAAWPYEAWLALGCSLGLVALAVLGARVPRPAPRHWIDAVTVAAAVLLIASLFLPWLKGFQGNGWSVVFSAMAGSLAVLLLSLMLGAGYVAVELAVGAAIYVMAAGFELTQYAHLGYGTPSGFAGAAFLLLGAARGLPSVPREPRRLVTRLVPLLACGCFLAIPIAALTYRLSPRLALDSPWRVIWFEVAAVLVALRLLGRWLRGSGDDSELLLLPFVLLALTGLDLIAIRGQGISWEGWASVVLCAALVALGWVERNGGLERLRVPDEIWRVDRLPG
jgi:hypothetical protein